MGRQRSARCLVGGAAAVYRPGMRGLYPIIDGTACEQRGLDVLVTARALLAANPPLLQLRAKDMAPARTLSLLEQLQQLVHGTSTRLFANDRPDLALMAGCAGVHVGQEDLSVAEVRQIAPQLAIGVSTHDLAQLSRALEQRPSYVALGPLFPTHSKADLAPMVDGETLHEASRRCRAAGIPLVGIGGIDAARLPTVAPYLDLASVISSVLADTPEQITARAEQLAAAFEASATGG